MNTTELVVGESSVTQEYGDHANGTTSSVQIIVPVFFSVCILVGTIGNSLVIVVMSKMHKSTVNGLSNTNIFILNLAVADLLFLILCVPFHTTVYTWPWWPFGRFFCYFAKYCEEASKIASAFSLAALSLDRFIAVGLAPIPRAKIRTRKNAIRGLIFVWITAIGIATPVIYTREYVLYKGLWVCAVANIKVRKPYEVILALFGYLLPLIIIIQCYVGVLWRIHKSSKGSLVASSGSKDVTKKVTLIVILVVVIFMICWLPHYIAILWLTFDSDDFLEKNWAFGFRIVSHCLAYANSCMNPFIYAFVSRQFRQDFAKVLTCRRMSGFETNVRRVSERVVRKLSTKPLANQNTQERENLQDKPNSAEASTADLKFDNGLIVAETETELLTENVTFGTSSPGLPIRMRTAV